MGVIGQYVIVVDGQGMQHGPIMADQSVGSVLAYAEQARRGYANVRGNREVVVQYRSLTAETQDWAHYVNVGTAEAVFAAAGLNPNFL